MKSQLLQTIVITISLVIAGCGMQGPREESGMVIGGVLGGIIDSPSLTIIVFSFRL